jgi:hypothetical protein
MITNFIGIAKRYQFINTILEEPRRKTAQEAKTERHQAIELSRHKAIKRTLMTQIFSNALNTRQPNNIYP